MNSRSILLVADEPGAIRLMGQLVGPMAQVRFATNGTEALRMARESEPDLVLLDAELPGMSGFQVCEELKHDRALRDVPVIFVTGHDEAALQAAGFKAGASDYLTKPLDPGLAAMRIASHLRAGEHARNLARLLTVDPLTLLPNRRGFEATLRREWGRAARDGEPLSLLAVDIDHYTALQNAASAAALDDCVREIAASLSGLCRRPGDVVGRVSERSFALLLPATHPAGAGHVARAALDETERLGLLHPATNVARRITVSIGIGCYAAAEARWTESGVETDFSALMRARRQPLDLVTAASLALTSARRAGRAQAWLLDVAHVDEPQRARRITQPARRPSQPMQPAKSTAPQSTLSHLAA